MSPSATPATATARSATCCAVSTSSSEDPELALDLYFRQCSVAVDCRDLSLMAATLANGGVNPLSGERALGREYVDRVLSVMTTCGMYDSAGEWVVDVGMPAKSGVAGGVLAVLPGQLGIAVFSPPLDPHGNSVRGVEVCRQISDRPRPQPAPRRPLLALGGAPQLQRRRRSLAPPPPARAVRGA